MNQTHAHIYPTLDQLPSADADRRQLAALLDQTVDAVPEDSALHELPAITHVLVGQVLGQCARKGILPKSAHVGTLIACGDALRRLTQPGSVADFRTAAKEALKSAVEKAL